MLLHLNSDCCAKSVTYSLEGEYVTQFDIDGGCNGFREALRRLAIGKRLNDILSVLSDVPCKGHTESCAAAICRSIKEYDGV